MRVAVLSSFPLLDRLRYKVRILHGLAERDLEVLVIYGGTRVQDYWAELRRRGAHGAMAFLSRIARRGERQSEAPPEEPEPDDRSLIDAAHTIGYDVRVFDRLGGADCVARLRDFAPVLTLNLSPLYVPRALLDAGERRVVGAHYADLPRIRGGDTVRWSVLLDHPLVVTHLFLAPALDMGDIVARTLVPVERGDGVEDLRRKCRRACERGHLRVVDAAMDGSLEAYPQRADEGATFYRMGRYLREKADRALADGAYSHYVDVK